MKKHTLQKVIVLSWLLLFATAAGADWKSFWQRPDQQAHQKLMDGDPSAAAGLFDDPRWRGISHYRAGDYEQAQKEFAAGAGDTALYNQALTDVRTGEYEDAIDKFQALLESNPEHEDAKHNLEITRELAKNEQQQQQQQGDESQQQDQQDGQQDNQQQQQDGQQQSDDESQQSEGESESQDTDEPDEQSQQGGELTSDPQQANQDAASDDEPSAAQAESQQQQARPEESDDESEDQTEVPVSQQGPTEVEQATEQWLRRIPDDPSQLLRNKIKLNHMIEHADVRDMQEPW